MSYDIRQGLEALGRSIEKAATELAKAIATSKGGN